MQSTNSHQQSATDTPVFSLFQTSNLHPLSRGPRTRRDTGLDLAELDRMPRLTLNAAAWEAVADHSAGAETAASLAAEAEALALEAERRLYLSLKRLTDVCGAVFALLILSPLMLLVAGLIKLNDRGPVLYAHRRVGERGREFTCYKFRTMVVDADQKLEQLKDLNVHQDHRTFKMADDPRVTRIGRWLRKASFDEVPQFWNVLRGEMSLVGPRPPVPKEVERYSLRDTMRLEVKPGLTCIWQVSGRSRLPFPAQLEMDLQYIRQRSFWVDMKLIVMTIPAVLFADGAC